MIQVDSLDVQIIVDNQTDNLSTNNCKSQPFFTEIQQITQSQKGKPDPKRSFSQFCCAGHGYSLLLTATKGDKSHTILFDVGPTSWLFEHNAKNLSLDMDKVEAIVLSHGHVDHTGGLLQALKQRKSANKISVYIGENGVVERGTKIDETTVMSIGKPDSEEEVLKYNGQYVYNREPKTLLDDFFMISGEVPRVTSYEIGLKGQMAKINGKWEKDELIKDEQFLMVNVKGKGIVLFVGCSHFGIVNAVKYAQKLGKDKIYAVFGGFHLSGSHGESIIDQTVKDLKILLPDSYIIAGHCTGWKAHIALEREFGKMYNPSFVGHLWKI